MPKSQYVDFRAVKAAITMEQVLDHYKLMDTFKRSGDSLSGPCPIHKGSNPTQFRVSTAKNVWNCFSECKHGGNVLDFIMRMENVSVQAAANKAVEWFSLDRKAMSTDRPQEEDAGDEAGTNGDTPKPKLKPAKEQEDLAPNKPLKFRLEKLQRDHPYLIKDRGLTQETIMDFGVGFCGKGTMANRIAIPIHNPAGEVVAYAGRHPGEPDKDTPKYKLPAGFHKSLEVFNLDRALKESSDRALVIVEGFYCEEIKRFSLSPDQIMGHLQKADQALIETEQLLSSQQNERRKVEKEVESILKLHGEGQIETSDFGRYHKPLKERLAQIEADIPRLQAEIDIAKVNSLSAEQVAAEARDLSEQWPNLDAEAKRKIVEAITEKITVGKEEIDITFYYIPSCKDMAFGARKGWDSNPR